MGLWWRDVVRTYEGNHTVEVEKGLICGMFILDPVLEKNSILVTIESAVIILAGIFIGLGLLYKVTNVNYKEEDSMGETPENSTSENSTPIVLQGSPGVPSPPGGPDPKDPDDWKNKLKKICSLWCCSITRNCCRSGDLLFISAMWGRWGR